MVSEKYKIGAVSIILVILGLLSMIFPVVSTLTVDVITAFLLLFLAIVFFVTATEESDFSRWSAAVNILLGFLSIILCSLLLIHPLGVTIVISFCIYIFGFMLIIAGITSLATSKSYKPKLYSGLCSVIFGILYIILGMFVENPIYLGIIVGVWLILTGIFYGYERETEEEFIEEINNDLN
ncbi:DUF308 domain-containing protein [Methanosphaera cuniculi]|uniref:DUF308 domain-containing protein n=1 Tax=Methanosphaera cuniculi TaxID=1077256 RepID=UPI0026DCEEBC|nr:DUF308 domain-containing protein [Methanosphaera cuniculi]